MSWKIKWNKDSSSTREIWEKEIHVQSAKGGVKVGVTSMGAHRNFRKGGMPKNAPHIEKKVTKRPPHGEQDAREAMRVDCKNHKLHRFANTNRVFKEINYFRQASSHNVHVYQFLAKSG